MSLFAFAFVVVVLVEHTRCVLELPWCMSMCAGFVQCFVCVCVSSVHVLFQFTHNWNKIVILFAQVQLLGQDQTVAMAVLRHHAQ